MFHGQPLGVLAALDPPTRDRGFSEVDAELLDAVGASAATAVMTAKSVERSLLRGSIQASEQARSRWARELHDETLQSLGALGMLLSSALANRMTPPCGVPSSRRSTRPSSRSARCAT